MVTAFEPCLTDTGRFLLAFEDLECEVVEVLKELDDDELIALAQSCDLPQCIYDALATFDCLENLDIFAEGIEDTVNLNIHAENIEDAEITED